MRLPFTHGGTLLHVAARRNLTRLCHWLLRLGVDVNRADILGRTALHRAVQGGAVDAARLLIAQRADLDARDWQGRTPLDLADAENSLAAKMREEISLRHGQAVKAIKVLRGPQ